MIKAAVRTETPAQPRKVGWGREKVGVGVGHYKIASGENNSFQRK